MLGLRALWKLYVAHLRARPVHELFALVGIATGVALVFAVQVANSSIAGSVDRLVGGITGDATLEVAARDARGFDERVGAAIERVPGVEVAAPLLEQRVTLRGPDGERIVQLVGQIGSMLVFEALMLGLAASAVGLVLGDLLSRWAFHSVPGYLSFAFPVGGQRVVSLTTVALAVGAGLLGSLLAVAQPFIDVYGLRSQEIGGPATPPPTAHRGGTAGAVAGGVLVLATVLVVVIAPEAAILGMIALVAGMLLVLPALLRLLIDAAWTLATRLQLGRGAGERVGGPFLVAVGTLRVRATRGSALASIVAIAVFGSVAIMGAHRDLLRGLDHASYGLTHSSDVWIAPGGDQNTLTTMDFQTSAADLAALRRAEGIAGVRTYQGTFLDYGDRRVWVIGRPAQDRITIPEGQVLDGDPERAERLIRAGGWAAISDQVAEEQGIEVGDSFELPAPTGPTRLRLAARLTNVGWAPGTVILNQRDFERAWGTSDPSAIEVDAAPGFSDREAAALVRDALGVTTLSVETAAQRWDVLRRNARQGLNRLTQIATLVIVGAIFATAAAMSATLWQRRGALADLRMQGFGRDQVWTSLLSETAMVLGLG
ncbi:MAG TPA: hypothetical protein VK506_02615, partial [Conexibacter sp.]|nr:hypothetical protein [Conexibacter sp.]